MTYRYIKNLRDASAQKCSDLSSLKTQKPGFQNKADYRAWCATDTTNHVFYNLERLWNEAKEIDVPELELPPGHLLYEDSADDDFDELADYNFDDFLVDDDF